MSNDIIYNDIYNINNCGEIIVPCNSLSLSSSLSNLSTTSVYNNIPLINDSLVNYSSNKSLYDNSNQLQSLPKSSIINNSNNIELKDFETLKKFKKCEAKNLNKIQIKQNKKNKIVKNNQNFIQNRSSGYLFK